MHVRWDNPDRRYVKVRADHTLDGKIRPLMFREEEGPVCIIDCVEDVRPAPSLKAGGQGIRYICRVGEVRMKLFYVEPYWFVEV